MGTLGIACRSPLSEFSEVLISTMPTPLASRTTNDFSMRAFTPRSQTTSLPATAAGSRVPGRQSAALFSVAPAAPEVRAATIGVSANEPVVDEPTYSSPLPRTSFCSAIQWVLAAADVVHGVGHLPSVLAPGPLLPAEVATKTPACAANIIATSTALKVPGSLVPPIE